jgi:hypothetical protein
LDIKQIEQLVLPLADEGLGHNEQNALQSFSATLRNHETGLNRLSQTYFVCQNAPALTKAAKGKNHGIDLVRIRIDARLALRSGIPVPVIRSPDPDQVLSDHAEVELVKRHIRWEQLLRQPESITRLHSYSWLRTFRRP